MCGIYGYFDRRNQRMDAAVLARMADCIAHRGPDERGCDQRNNVAVGCLRLSIIDIDKGHQPMLSDDGSICVAQNGEIYNFIELRKDLEDQGVRFRTNSDTEVILRLYETEGIDMLSRLNGMFAMAIYDANDGVLILARDRLGVKPLFVHDDGDRLLFASEIKSLLQSGISRRPNAVALRHFLDLGYVPPSMTAFDGVEPVPPGAYFVVGREETRIVHWWRIRNEAAEDRPESYWTDELLGGLDDAVRLRLRSDVPFGMFLSGGIDSSTVAGLACPHVSQQLKSFTISFRDPTFDESRFAELASRRFGTDHYCEEVTPTILDLWPSAVYHADQPHSDSSFLAVWRVSSLAAGHVKMVLTGDGGDEFHAGYNKYLAIERAHEFQGGTRKGIAQAWLDQFAMLQKCDPETAFTRDFMKSSSGADTLDLAFQVLGECDRMDSINRMLYLDSTLLLPGNNLVKSDRMTMAAGLEARSPFLDRSLVEMSFRIPGELKLRNGQTKYILKKAVEKLIGKDLVERPKQQFTMPIGDWLRAGSISIAERLLNSNRCVERGIFHKTFLDRIVTEHRLLVRNHTQLLRSLISLELWFRMYIDTLYDRPPTFEEML